MAKKVEPAVHPDADDGEDKPSLRQRLHWATDDRDAEAEALADRAGDEVDEEAAKLAVGRAHGEVRDGVETENEDDLATAEDAKTAAEDTDDR
jgi:hypothetical protein